MELAVSGSLAILKIPMTPALENACNRIQTDLRENILPFWISHVKNPSSRSFHGALSNDRWVDHKAERGAVLGSRILWAYSAAYQKLANPEYLKMASFAYRDLGLRYLDPEHGGFFWSIHPNDRVLNDRKHLYGQAFAIYGLSEYFAASGEIAALEMAKNTFHLIEAKARDSEFGGYYESLSREWLPQPDTRLSPTDQNDSHSQNTLLHLMEAYANLARVWPDPQLFKALEEIVEALCNRVIAADGHSILFLKRDWTPNSDQISYGHDIETSWLICEASEILAKPEWIHRTRALALISAEHTLKNGTDEDGGIYRLGNKNGVIDHCKDWWAQAEAVVGFLNAFQISKEQRFLTAALKTWRFIEVHLIDHANGEWFWGLNHQGRRIDQPKVNFWKCPYHNTRMALEVARRFSRTNEILKV